MKSEPVRTCLGCGKKGDKKSFIRFVCVEGRIVIDEKKVLPGRGAYVCSNLDCATKLKKNKRIFRALRINNNVALQNFFDELIEKLNK